MTFRKTRVFTEGELDFMKVLWDIGDATPEDVMAALKNRGRELTYGTVRNVLVVMIEKGYVSRRKEGKAYRYTAKINEADARKSMIQDLLERAFDGSESSMVATLLHGREVKSDEMTEIRRLIDDGEKEDVDERS